MISITKKEYEKEFIQKGYEQFTEDQFRKWIDLNSDILVKGEQGMLEDDLEKAEYEAFKEEVRSFTAVEVVEPSSISKFRIEKSIMYVRPKQVEWDEQELIKGENGEEIEKARSGRYKDTSLNRKLGRVGNPYGGKKGTEEKKATKLEGKKGQIDMSKVKFEKDSSGKFVGKIGDKYLNQSGTGFSEEGYHDAGEFSKEQVDKLKQSSSNSTDDKGKSEKKDPIKERNEKQIKDVFKENKKKANSSSVSKWLDQFE